MYINSPKFMDNFLFAKYFPFFERFSPGCCLVLAYFQLGVAYKGFPYKEKKRVLKKIVIKNKI